MAEYQLSHSGLQIDTNLNFVDTQKAINGIMKCNGSGTPSVAVSGTDYAPPYTAGTSDMTAGTTPLTTGTVYFMYEVE